MPDCDENMAFCYVMPKKDQGTPTSGDVISATHKRHEY